MFRLGVYELVNAHYVVIVTAFGVVCLALADSVQGESSVAFTLSDGRQIKHWPPFFLIRRLLCLRDRGGCRSRTQSKLH